MHAGLMGLEIFCLVLLRHYELGLSVSKIKRAFILTFIYNKKGKHNLNIMCLSIHLKVLSRKPINRFSIDLMRLGQH
jgi:hypothetical protein